VCCNLSTNNASEPCVTTETEKGGSSALEALVSSTRQRTQSKYV